MKKIAFIATNEMVAWGGSEACWSAAAEKLVRRGVDVRVSAKDWGRPIEQVERLRAAGCQIVSRKQPSLVRRVGRRILSRSGSAREDVKNLGAGADLVVVSQGGTQDGLPWLDELMKRGTPYAIIVQANSEEWWPSDGHGEHLARVYEGARAVYFVSEANRDLARKQFHTVLERARVIRNPFNVSYDARPAWPGDAADRLSLACVARLDAAQKGHELLIEVLSLPHWRTRPVEVTFVGSGANERSLQEMARRAGLTSVHFEGFVTDIEELWSRHHALVLASRFEGLPLAMVEAMLCGRAAIVTDVGGNREMVRDGLNGFLAKAPTVELIDEALDRAWEKRTLLREMGERAAVDVRRLVSSDPAEDFAKELLALTGRRVTTGDEAQEKRERAEVVA